MTLDPLRAEQGGIAFGSEAGVSRPAGVDGGTARGGRPSAGNCPSRGIYEAVAREDVGRVRVGGDTLNSVREARPYAVGGRDSGPARWSAAQRRRWKSASAIWWSTSRNAPSCDIERLLAVDGRAAIVFANFEIESREIDLQVALDGLALVVEAKGFTRPVCAVVTALEPVGIEAALEEQGTKEAAAIRLAQSALAEARCQADRAEAHFDAVQPANQNVFHNLARKWKDCRSRVRACDARLQVLEGSSSATFPRVLALLDGDRRLRCWNLEDTGQHGPESRIGRGVKNFQCDSCHVRSEPAPMFGFAATNMPACRLTQIRVTGSPRVRG